MRSYIQQTKHDQPCKLNQGTLQNNKRTSEYDNGASVTTESDMLRWFLEPNPNDRKEFHDKEVLLQIDATAYTARKSTEVLQEMTYFSAC